MTMDHYQRINHVTRYIRHHVDEPLNRELLAAMAGFSVPHFHRIFTAHVGETIAQYVRRVRMESAARQLLNPEAQVTDIAFECGYETHSSFSKAFRQTFGINPTAFRNLNLRAAAMIISRRIPYSRKDLEMKPQEIRTMTELKVLYARAAEKMTQPAFQTAPAEAFDKLMGYVMANHSMEDVSQIVAIYPDECDIGKTAHFDAGAIFAEGKEPSAPEGLSYQTLAGGRWAIFRHIGPYDNLWQTWNAIYRDWLPNSGEELRDVLCFEDYVDDPGQVGPDELRTDIYIPIK